MKELEHETMIKRPLKSLLKKPNQNKQRTHKNRVVINEKLNEFFAADYIILIKEECCADYEEECDCCCQETEMIRVGNCKECRAELTRQLASGIDPHNNNNNNIINNCINNNNNNNNNKLINNNDESQCEDEGEDEEEEYEEEIDDDYDDDVESSEEHCDNRNCNNIINKNNKSDKLIIYDNNGKIIHNDNFIIDNNHQHHNNNIIVDNNDDKIHQQQAETLSPPEGYKDVCDDDDDDNNNGDDCDDDNHNNGDGDGCDDNNDHDDADDDRQDGNLLRGDICTGPVCGECNFYHQQKQQHHQQQQQQHQHQHQQQQRNSDDKDHVHGQVDLENIEGEEDNCQERLDDAIQPKNDQAQQTTPDTHQRYLVETITMTTVTERRIVREISEDENNHKNTIDEPDTPNNKITALPMIKNNNNDTNNLKDDDEFILTNNDNKNINESLSTIASPTTTLLKQNNNSNNNNTTTNNEDNNDNELSTSSSSSSYKKLVNNSLKPNSAVRQLFPDPRFISPPPQPSLLTTKSLSLSTTDDTTTDSDNSDGQKFLLTTESLRLFDNVKRTNISGNRSDSSESDTSTIKRTIERNALRRSLICKYDKNNKKINNNTNNNNLRGKDLTLEERIRQLTCNIDQDDDIIDSASETQSIDHDDNNIDFPIRTSPSGEEQQQYIRDGRIIRQNYHDNDNILLSSSSSPIQHSHLHHQHHHHHHHNHHNHQHITNNNTNNSNNQSAYRKISDLFGQKKLDNNNKMPDIGLGDLTTTTTTTTSINSSSTSSTSTATTLMKDITKSQITKMSNDARKQFLSSLAPLSCVGTTGIDCRDDYYQLTTTTTKKLINNELLQCYNSDSSYSLEDIDDVLKIDDKYNKNSCGPPDVTRGTPTGNCPDSQDATNDELLAFVEQDKTRTERLKRRYDTDDLQQQQQQQQQHHDDCSVLKNYNNNSNNLLCKNKLSNSNNNNNNSNGDNNNSNDNNNSSSNNNNDDDDDELNDYGFNKRPSVRGIKPKVDDDNNDIIRQINNHSTIPIPTTINERPLNLTSWQYYEHDSLDKNIQYVVDDTNSNICIDKIHDGRDMTLKRMNTMQRQIDDIYQTIAETTVSVKAKTMDRCASYHETTTSSSSTLPRNLSHQQQYHDPRNNIPSTIYNTLPTKNRRPTSAIQLTNNNYSCGVLPIDNNNTKCYRTMYFVPYSGMSDPTYQNIQKILPPHSSTLPTNYANHIERYPYPRNKNDEQLNGQTPTRYYTTRQPINTNINNQLIQSQQLQLQQQQLLQLQQQQQQQLQQHLHAHQNDQDYRYSTTPTIGMQTGIQLQHHQHISQLSTYNLQKMPTYTVMAPSSRTGNYSYSQIHQQGRNNTAVVSAATATAVASSSSSSSASSAIGSSVDIQTLNSMNTNIQYTNGGNFIGNLGNTSLSSSTSSVLNSPTKLRINNNSNNNSNTCSSERGVPEGAASAPAHDFIVSTNNVGNTFIGHPNNLPPPNTQNSIYYAMNV